ncbi:helix-turn-helix transcriptional regulator [Ruegeria hyattellae]|jgi:predicted DNA-binding transcriptional regulator YafY|uniref:helix-turn-helix transcriptional regulator n=1 Tax=Ruegeria hyattellae TaxID=3233337 RepID=UPI00355B057D
MRRTERLFQIIQILRSTRSPITGRELADELEISIRTLYRDMAELAAQRIPITGEAGMGYVLDDGYDMPPLMLTADELEAAALGAAWVASEADSTLARAARDLVAKLSDTIPKELRPVVLDASSKPIKTRSSVKENFDSALLRHAIRERYRLQLAYTDSKGDMTDRVVWPLLIAFLDRSRYLVAWCETRDGIRHFKTDRVQELKVLGEKYLGRRAKLIKEWEDAMAKRMQN